MISRKDLEEKLWNDSLQLSESQVEEELLLPMIEKLNKYPELNSDWSCTGNTLIAVQRHQVDGGRLPVFFVCTIKRFLQARKEIPEQTKLQ